MFKPWLFIMLSICGETYSHPQFVEVESSEFRVGHPTFTIFVWQKYLLKPFAFERRAKWEILLKLEDEGTHSHVVPALDITCDLTGFDTSVSLPNDRFKTTCKMPQLPKSAASFQLRLKPLGREDREDAEDIHSFVSNPIQLIYDAPSDFSLSFETVPYSDIEMIQITANENRIDKVKLEIQYFAVVGPPRRTSETHWQPMVQTMHDFAAGNPLRLEFKGEYFGYIWRIQIVNSDGDIWFSDPRLVKGKFVSEIHGVHSPQARAGHFVPASVINIYQFSWGEKIQAGKYTREETKLVKTLSDATKMQQYFEKNYSRMTVL